MCNLLEKSVQNDRNQGILSIPSSHGIKVVKPKPAGQAHWTQLLQHLDKVKLLVASGALGWGAHQAGTSPVEDVMLTIPPATVLRMSRSFNISMYTLWRSPSNSSIYGSSTLDSHGIVEDDILESVGDATRFVYCEVPWATRFSSYSPPNA